MPITINPSDSVAVTLAKLVAAITALGTPITVNPPRLALSRLGVNADKSLPTYYTQLSPFFNVLKSMSLYQDATSSDPNGTFCTEPEGYPKTGTQWFGYMPINDTTMHPGASTDYVYVTSCVGRNFTPDQATNIVRSVDPNGNERVTFSMAARGATGVKATRVDIYNAGTHPWQDGVDFEYCCHPQDEAAILAGKYFTADAIKAVQVGGVVRFMDWCGVNSTPDTRVDMSSWTPLRYSSWNCQQGTRVPVEVMCALANEAGIIPHINFPHAFTDLGIRQLVRVIKANLLATTPYILEPSNEVWNEGSFTQGSYFHNLYSPAKANTDDPTWGNFGYRAAQMFAVAQDEDGHTGRCITYMGFQGTNAATYYGQLAGMRVAIADFGTQGSPIYNADFAARYGGGRPLGKLVRTGGGATYLSAGLPPQAGADTTTVQSWVTAWTNGDPSGLNNYFTQHRVGGLLANAPAFVLSNMTAQFASVNAILTAENITPIAYEGGPVHDNVPGGFQAFFGAARLDTRSQALTADWATACLSAGFATILHYTDVNAPGEDYGLIENATSLTSPRYLGFSSVAASPPAPAQLAVTVSTAGAYTVGKAPVTTAKVTGGQGPFTFAWSGLAPGRSSDGDATVAGVLTAVGDVPTGKLVVTDQSGAQASATFDQPVAAAAAGYRFLKFTPYGNPNYITPADNGFRVGCKEVVMRDGSGSVIPYDSPSGLSASSYSGNVPQRVCDGSLANSYLIDPTSGNGDAGTWIIDLGDGTAATPASLDIGECVEVPNFSMGSGRVEIAKDPGNLPGTPSFAAINSGATFVQVFEAPLHSDHSPSLAYTNGFTNVLLTYPS